MITTTETTTAPDTITTLAAAKDHIGIWIELKRRSADEALAKFQKNLAADPTYAMEWGSDAIEAAGWMKVIASLDRARAAGYGVEQMAAEALRMVLQGAKYPPASNERNQQPDRLGCHRRLDTYPGVPRAAGAPGRGGIGGLPRLHPS